MLGHLIQLRTCSVLECLSCPVDQPSENLIVAENFVSRRFKARKDLLANRSFLANTVASFV
jgi:hypothetical protein